MYLDVSELIRKRKDELSFDVSFEIDEYKRGNLIISFNSPIRFKGKAFYDGQMINVEGIVKTSIQTECSRCLRTVDYPLEFEVFETFSKQQGEDIYPLLEDRIKLDDAIFDNLILSLPIRVLCNEECKGLCPYCGRNLNEGHCDCQRVNIDPRLEALKQFFKGD